MIKIAFDYQAFFIQEYGGVSRYFSILAGVLNSLESVEAKIFAPLHTNAYLEKLHDGVAVGLSVRGRKRSKKAHRWVNRLVSRHLVRKYRPDIFHETYWSSGTLAPPRVPVVVTVHDMIHERFPEMFSRRDRTSSLKRAAVERADHVICISESTRKDLIKYFGTPQEKISVVYHGFERLASTGSQGQLLERSGRPYFLYVGHRGGYKNFDNFIRAFAASRELKENFRVVCFGGGPLTVKEVALLGEIGLELSQVTQVAGDDEVLARHYERAFAFIYPSLYEGFGIPPLEAMSLGCPVICSETSSIPEVVGNAAEFFDPESVYSIQHAMERVATSTSRRNELIQLGAARYVHFSWPRCARQTLEIYEALI